MAGNKGEKRQVCDKEDAPDDGGGNDPDDITSNNIGENVGNDADDNGGNNVVETPAKSEKMIGGNILEANTENNTENVTCNETNKCISNTNKKSVEIDSGEVGGNKTHGIRRQHKKTCMKKLIEVRCLQTAWQDMMTSHPDHDVIKDGVNKAHDEVTDDGKDGSEDTGDEDDGTGDDGTPATHSEEDPDVADDGAGCGGQDSDHDVETKDADSGGVGRVQNCGRDPERSLESDRDVIEGGNAALPAGGSGPRLHLKDGGAESETPPHPIIAADTREDVSSAGQLSKVKVDLEGNNKTSSLQGLAACKAKFASHYASMTRKRMDINSAGRSRAATVLLEDRMEEAACMSRKCRLLRAEVAQEELDLLHHLQSLQQQKMNLQRAIIDLETSVNSTREPNDKVDIEAFLRTHNCSRECQEVARELKGNMSPLCPPTSTEQDLEGCPTSDDPLASDDRVPAVAPPMLGEPDPKDSYSIFLPWMKKDDSGLDECSKTRRGNLTPPGRSGRSGRRLKSTESRLHQIRKQKLETANDQKGVDSSMVKASDQLGIQKNNPNPIDQNAKTKVCKKKKKNRTVKIEATSVGLLRSETSGEPITKPRPDNKGLKDSVDIDLAKSSKTNAQNSVTKGAGSEQFLDVPSKGARKARAVGARSTRHERRSRQEPAEYSDGKIQSVISSNFPDSDGD